MIPLIRPYFSGNELKYIKECIKTRWVSSLGKFVDKFEERFTKFCDSRYGISVCNGTAALHLCLMVLGIGKNDEVIIPDLTFVATANAVCHSGATPVLVDAETPTWNIDPQQIKDKITSRTKAIIVVHLYGYPARMDVILRIAKKHNLYVIEDACQAHGALFRGRKIGSMGDLGVFSFFGNKIITTGEGAMIVTDNKKFNDRARVLRNHGISRRRKYFSTEVGYNYHLTNIQAAIGLAQLENLNYMIRRKIEIAKLYNHFLKEVDDIVFPPEESWAKNVYWLYSILVSNNRRNMLMKKLWDYGIETRQFFIPMHRMPHFRTKEIFPVSDRLSRSGVSLPCFVEITHREIEYICNKIKKILTKGR